MRCCTAAGERLASALLVPRTLKAVLRVLTAALVVVLCARTANAQPTPPPTGLSPGEAFALMLADQTGECSAEDHENPLELCGVELFGDFIDDQYLLMPRDTCSVLLEELFKDQVCAPGDYECQQSAHGVVPSPGPKLATTAGGAGSPVLCDADDDLLAAAMRRWRRAVSEAMPRDRVVAPPVPPPELRA